MSREQWIEHIRGNLPEEGETTLIVASPSGARYLQLSRAQIDDFLTARQWRRRLLARGATVLTVCLATVIGLYAHQVARLSDRLSAHEAYIAALHAPLLDLADTMPEVVRDQPLLADESMPVRIDGLKETIRLLDDSFRFHIESTRHLLGENHEQMLALIADLGTGYAFRPDHIEPFASGGPLEMDGVIDLTAAYLDEALFRLMFEHAQLNELLDSMPTSWPMRNSRTTSRFGMRQDPITRRQARHLGMDLVSRGSHQVLASAAGTVTFAGRDGPFGKSVRIDHGNQITTLYAHLNELNVNAGDVVDQGDIVGIMGSTGRSTGRHLHFEIHVRGKPVDPIRFLGIANHVREQKNGRQPDLASRATAPTCCGGHGGGAQQD
jgi:murein DD-endopeptidase MepM/ murein hydrolase activator NlpD